MLHIRYRTLDTPIRIPSKNPTAEQIASAISAATGADPQTIKLLVSGQRDRMIRLLTTPTQTAQELGKSVTDCLADFLSPIYELLGTGNMNACRLD